MALANVHYIKRSSHFLLIFTHLLYENQIIFVLLESSKILALNLKYKCLEFDLQSSTYQIFLIQYNFFDISGLTGLTRERALIGWKDLSNQSECVLSQ